MITMVTLCVAAKLWDSGPPEGHRAVARAAGAHAGFEP